MEIYQSKRKEIPGLNFKEVEKIAKSQFKLIKKKAKTIPYVRSAYFKKEKVFLNIFWSHLYEKREDERTRRLKFFECAIDLIKNSKVKPVIVTSKLNKSETLYRFMGRSGSGNTFFVQIKENKNHRKDLISIFRQN